MSNGAATKQADGKDIQVDASHTKKEMEVVHLIRGYRSRGHLLARQTPSGSGGTAVPGLDLADFKLSETDLDTVFEAGTEVFGRPATLA